MCVQLSWWAPKLSPNSGQLKKNMLLIPEGNKCCNLCYAVFFRVLQTYLRIKECTYLGYHRGNLFMANKRLSACLLQMCISVSSETLDNAENDEDVTGSRYCLERNYVPKHKDNWFVNIFQLLFEKCIWNLPNKDIHLFLFWVLNFKTVQCDSSMV